MCPEGLSGGTGILLLLIRAAHPIQITIGMITKTQTNAQQILDFYCNDYIHVSYAQL
jgi:hypothetical protein